MPYITEYPKSVEALPATIEDWLASATRKRLKDEIDYMEGDNVTIKNIKKYYWSGSTNGFVENKYIANYKLPYGVYADIVSQPVNSLLDETPIIKKYKPEESFLKTLGYSMKEAGDKAKGQGVAFMFMDYTGNITVGDTENCIPYYDDYTGALLALIRFWKILLPTQEYYIIETFTQEGMAVYSTFGGLNIKKPLTPYKIKRLQDATGETMEAEAVNFPVKIFRNNKNRKSDLTPSVRSKIDIIDIVNSGFANNIEDFSDIFWVIKGSSGLTEEDLFDFEASIKRTRKLLLDGEGDVDTKQVIIPTEARQRFIQDRKTELIFETGIIDAQTITTNQITATAIKAATMKLRQRVSDFEWEAYRTCTELIKQYQAYQGVSAPFDVEFVKMFLDNKSEEIDNLNKIRPDISRETYLEKLQGIGMITSTKDELKRIDKEALQPYSTVSIVPKVEEDRPNGGQSTDANG